MRPAGGRYHLIPPARRYAAVTVALAWLVPGTVLALLAPRFGAVAPAMSAAFSWMPLLATAALIGWNLVEAVRAVGRTGRTLSAGPMTAMQVALFTLLFFQISCHLGADHFHFDRRPRSWDWLLFVAAHAVRAGDILDFVEAYGLNFQSIRHASPLTAGCLMLMHLIIDLFLLRLAFEGVSRLRERLLAEVSLAVKASVASCAVTLFACVWLVSALWVRPWRGADMALWLVDNVVRVVDFVDAMSLFEVRLHNVPQTPWEGSLTFVCRLFIGLALGRLLGRAGLWLSMHFLRGFGLSATTLEQIARKGSGMPAEFRNAARDRLNDLRRRGPEPNFPRRLATPATLAVAAVGLLLTAWPSWDATAGWLAGRAADAGEPRRGRALLTLRRLGPCGDAAAAPLVQHGRSDANARTDAFETLAYLGPAGREALADILRTGEPETALDAVAALVRRGPEAAPVLVGGLESPHAEVRQAARAAALTHGRAALRALLDHVTSENLRPCVDLFEEIDPDYWHLYPSRSRHIAEVRKLHGPLRALKRSGAPAADLGRAAAEVGRLGALGRPAAPLLIKLLTHVDPAVSEAAANALVETLAADPNLVPEMIELLAPATPPAVREAAARRLGEIGSPARTAVPRLTAMLGLPGREIYRDALAKVGPPAAVDFPAMVPLLGSVEPEIRQTTLRLLESGDRNWRKAAGVADAAAGLGHYLADTSAPRRLAAAWALGVLGPAAAVPDLLAVLGDPARLDTAEAVLAALDRVNAGWARAPEARDAALRAAALAANEPGNAALQQLSRRLFPTAFPTADGLIALLADRDAERRKGAAEVLGSLGQSARPAVPHLIRLVPRFLPAEGNEPLFNPLPVSRAALRALDRIAPDWPASGVTASTLQQLRVDADAMPREYATNEEVKDVGVRKSLARDVIRRLAEANGPLAVSIIVEAAYAKLGGSKPGQVAEYVHSAMRRIPPDAIPELVALADLAYLERVRQIAAEALKRVGAEWMDTPLRAAAAVRLAEAHVLDVHVAPPGRLGEPALARNNPADPYRHDSLNSSWKPALLRGEDGNANRERLRRLTAGVAAAARPLLAVLVSYARHPHSLSYEKEKDLDALLPLFDDLGAMLDKADPDWRRSEPAAKAVAALQAPAEFPGPHRPLIMYALGVFGPAARDAAMPLVNSEMESDDGHRLAAVRTLGRLGLRPNELAPTLIQILTRYRTKSYTVAEVARQLGEVGPVTKDVVPLLAQLLSYQAVPGLASPHNDKARIAAARSLAKIGPPAKAALPALKRAAAEFDEELRREARNAINAIGKK